MATRADLRVSNDILGLIGSTPMVRLARIVMPRMAQILAKLESFNPMGSVKDRIALAMVEDAETKGALKRGFTIIEPTSGNTGIGLAMVAAAKGYRCILTMPEEMSPERQAILRHLGAEIVLTPRIDGMTGAIRKAEELADSVKNSFMPQQFSNLVNPEIHRRTTAREILASVQGDIAALVCGVGTGGTITGVGEVLKQRDSRTRIVAVEPAASPVLSGGKVGLHRIQGIGAGFVPKVLNRDIIDEIVKVTDEDAYEMTVKLARTEGIFAGISSGAAVWAALRVAWKLDRSRQVVVLLPDAGERYLSLSKYFD